MSDTREMISMRQAQWARAKGEMYAFLQFFWPIYDPITGKPIHGVYEVAKEAIDKCIDDVDGVL